MQIEDVKRFLRKVEKFAEEDDFEAAHSTEIDLWYVVLRAVAGGAENAQELAKEALKSQELEFGRYCA